MENQSIPGKILEFCLEKWEPLYIKYQWLRLVKMVYVR